MTINNMWFGFDRNGKYIGACHGRNYDRLSRKAWIMSNVPVLPEQGMARRSSGGFHACAAWNKNGTGTGVVGSPSLEREEVPIEGLFEALNWMRTVSSSGVWMVRAREIDTLD